MTARGWWLNLDAEEELDALRRGIPWDPSRGAKAPARAVEWLRSPGDGLVKEADVWVNGPGTGPASGAEVGGWGLAWCPTPSALDGLRSAGWMPRPGPSVDALIRANARETSSGLDPLPGTLVVDSMASLEAALQRPMLERAPDPSASVGQPDGAPGPMRKAPAWWLRTSLCAAGRGRRIVERGDVGAGRWRPWAETALGVGPIQVQPMVDVVAEFALHGWIHGPGDRPGASADWGSPVPQQARAGTWRGSGHALMPGIRPHEAARLRDVAGRAADLLRAIGYFGPVGVDSFRWTDANGVERFHAATDVNARFTMGWRIGAGERFRA